MAYQQKPIQLKSYIDPVFLWEGYVFNKMYIIIKTEGFGQVTGLLYV